MKITLSGCPPFSLRAVVESHGWARLAPFGGDPAAGLLTRVERLDSGRVVELAMRQAPDGVTVEAPGRLRAEERAETSRKVWWMLGLGQDLSPFYALAREEPKLAHVAERAMGRILRSPTLFEDLVKTILTTNTTWAGTTHMVEALVETWGEPLPADPTCHAFPTPEALATAGERGLRTGARLGYRAPYVLELAERVASGELDLEALRTADVPTTELRRRLLALKGVGAYAAASLLVLLGRYDFLPVDTWARKLVSHEWYGGRPVRQAEIDAAFERWGEWKALAYWFWDWSYQGSDD